MVEFDQDQWVLQQPKDRSLAISLTAEPVQLRQQLLGFRL